MRLLPFVLMVITATACKATDRTSVAKKKVWDWYDLRYARCSNEFRAAPIEIALDKSMAAWDFNDLNDARGAFSYQLELTIKYTGKLCGEQAPPICTTGTWTVGGRIAGTFLDNGPTPISINEKMVSALPALPIEDTGPGMGIFLEQACVSN